MVKQYKLSRYNQQGDKNRRYLERKGWSDFRGWEAVRPVATKKNDAARDLKILAHIGTAAFCVLVGTSIGCMLIRPL